MMEFYNVFLFSTEKQCNVWSWLCSLDPYLKYIPLLASIIGLVALIVATANFLRKSKIKIIATVEVNKNSYNGDYSFTAFTLKNEKDKPVIIYAVYFRLGYDMYIELEDFRYKDDLSDKKSEATKDRSHILKPYEIYHKQLDRAYWYSNFKEKIKIDNLLENKRIKRTVVISTSEGKYVAKLKTPHWFPNFGSRLFLKAETNRLLGFEDWDRLDFVSLNKNEISNNWFSYAVGIIIQFFKKLKSKCLFK